MGLFSTITKSSNSFIRLLRNLDIEIHLGGENVLKDTYFDKIGLEKI